MAGVDAIDVDMVLMATSSPDDAFGSAPEVQARIGADNAVAFDLTAACSGFVIGMVTATQYIRTGFAKNVLVIGADALSRYIDWTDRRTCILFGDGSGAVLLQAVEGGECGFLGADMHSSGTGGKHLHCHFSSPPSKPFNAGATGSEAAFENITMNGGEVFKFAVRAVPKTILASLEQAGLGAEDIDWLVLHQANQRIIDSASQRLGVPPEQVVSTIAKYGNTSAASIPLALAEAVQDGRVGRGDTIAVAGFGAGLTWGSALFKWGAERQTPDGAAGAL